LNYVLEKTDADEVVLKLNFPANRRVVIPANRKTAKDYKVDNLDAKPEFFGAQGWPAMLYQVVYPPQVKVFSGIENIVVDGKSLNCRYGSVTNALGISLKQWISAEVAGGLVKAEAVYDADRTKMKLTLLHVKAP
jgi:hypothetical protein